MWLVAQLWQPRPHAAACGSQLGSKRLLLLNSGRALPASAIFKNTLEGGTKNLSSIYAFSLKTCVG